MPAKFHAGFTFVVVRGGDMVVTGPTCAEVGNFRNTAKSRLHVYAVQAGEAGSVGEGMPVAFNRRYPVRDMLFVD